MSWISLDDLLVAFYTAILDVRLAGPVNACAPASASNTEFTQTLARVLGVRAPLRVPRFALRAAFGRLADEALLSSSRVKPAALERIRFPWRHAALEEALRHHLGRHILA
jgi:uncharacterized protein